MRGVTCWGSRELQEHELCHNPNKLINHIYHLIKVNLFMGFSFYTFQDMSPEAIFYVS